MPSHESENIPLDGLYLATGSMLLVERQAGRITRARILRIDFPLAQAADRRDASFGLYGYAIIREGESVTKRASGFWDEADPIANPEATASEVIGAIARISRTGIPVIPQHRDRADQFAVSYHHASATGEINIRGRGQCWTVRVAGGGLTTLHPEFELAPPRGDKWRRFQAMSMDGPVLQDFSMDGAGFFERAVPALCYSISLGSYAEAALAGVDPDAIRIALATALRSRPHVASERILENPHLYPYLTPSALAPLFRDSSAELKERARTLLGEMAKGVDTAQQQVTSRTLGC